MQKLRLSEGKYVTELWVSEMVNVKCMWTAYTGFEEGEMTSIQECQWCFLEELLLKRALGMSLVDVQTYLG